MCVGGRAALTTDAFYRLHPATTDYTQPALCSPPMVMRCQVYERLQGIRTSGSCMRVLQHTNNKPTAHQGQHRRGARLGTGLIMDGRFDRRARTAKFATLNSNPTPDNPDAKPSEVHGAELDITYRMGSTDVGVPCTSYVLPTKCMHAQEQSPMPLFSLVLSGL